MKLQAVILDWAGTVVDHGSRAPMGAFVRAFAEFGVAISIADARGPMGMAKWDHIRAVGKAPAVATAWRTRHGRDFSERDVDAIFRVFEPMNIAAVRDHADIIPGAIAAIDELRARGIKIGATTGYTRAIMEVLAPIAATAFGSQRPTPTPPQGPGRHRAAHSYWACVRDQSGTPGTRRSPTTSRTSRRRSMRRPSRRAS